MGFLGTQPDDENLIQSAGENGTTTAPAPDTFDNLGQAIVENVGAGFGETANLALKLLSNTPAPSYVPSASDEIQLRQQNPGQGPLDSDIAQSRQQLEKMLEEGRKVEGQGSQTVGSVAKGLTEYGIGTLAAGGVGGALTVGGVTADDTYHDMRAQGFDDKTAQEGAAFQGVLAGGGALVPGGFGKLATKVLGGAAVNEVFGLASRAGQAEILKANGYDDAAEAQKVFDGQQMTVDGILGAGFGFFGGLHEVAVKPSQVDAAMSAAADAHAQNAGPGIAATPEAAATHEQLFGDAVQSVAAGEPVKLDPAKVQTMAEGLAPDPAVAAQQHAAAQIYAADQDVQVAVEAGPLLDEAYAQLGQEPTHEAQPVEHAGNPSTFLTPDELARAEHSNKVAQLVAQHGIPAEAAADMHGLLTLPARDALTGFYDKNSHEQILRNAIAHARESGETVHYVEADSLNMGGRNAAIGHTKTNDTLRAEAHAFAQELGRAGHVVPVRHGGDEFSAIVTGARSDADIQAALDRANERVQAAAEKAGLGKLKNPKGGEGLGLATAFRRLKGDERPRDVTQPIDEAIEAQKNEIHNGLRTGEAAGTGGAKPGATGKAPGGAAREAQGQRGGERSAQALATEEAPRTAPLSPANEARLRQLEAQYGGDQLFDLGDGERLTFAQIAQRMREEAANADSDNKALDAAVACFARTGGNV